MPSASNVSTGAGAAGTLAGVGVDSDGRGLAGAAGLASTGTASTSAAGAAAKWLTTSSLVRRPPLPVPAMSAGLSLFSASRRVTAGLWSPAGAAAAPLPAAAGWAAGAVAAPPSSMRATVSPIWTVAPSGLTRRRTPAAGLGTSTLALSVSSSQSGSSAVTWAPSALCHLISTASRTESPSPGMSTLVGMGRGILKPGGPDWKGATAAGQGATM